MRKININELSWQLNQKENVLIGEHKGLITKELGIYHVKLSSREELKKHFHKRPDNGKEIFFFYNGGHFIIQLENEEEEYNSDSPLYLLFASKEIHGIKNLSDDPLEFQALYYPDFQKGEIVQL